ncbi:MAG: hypothetical protein K0S65_2665, partial [Labilithrix sp.]|nr:hypothetical protein [Labilithrix sp.]
FHRLDRKPLELGEEPAPGPHALVSFGSMWRRSSRGGTALAVLGCLALASTDARADESPSKLDLVYTAPSECPSRAELERQVHARVPATWLTGADTRRFEVHIVRDEQGYTGRLDVRGPGHEPNVREIRAATCQAVSTSVAVFLAIALDPSNEDEDLAESSESEETTPSIPEGATSPKRRRKSGPKPSAPLQPAHWTWSSGFHVTHLRAPAPAWGGRVHAELARVPARSFVAPAARLSWGWADFSLFPNRAGEAKFRLRSARAEGCARFMFAPFAVAPCLAFDVGELAATAPELPRGGHATTVWVAAGATLRGTWSPVRWLSVEADVGFLAPFGRTSFVLVEPYRAVYRPPVLLLEGTAGACISGRFH